MAHIWIETLRDLYKALDGVAGVNRALRQLDFDRDKTRFESALEEQGIAYLTTVLPSYGEAVDQFMFDRLRGIDTEYPLRKWIRPIDVLFQHVEPGQLSQHQAIAVRIVRTLFFGFKKLELEYTEDQVTSRLSSYLEIEAELPSPCNVPDLSVLDVAAVCAFVLQGYTPTNERPAHGPGAVADGLTANGKWDFPCIHEPVHQAWPYYEHVYLPIYEASIADRVFGPQPYWVESATTDDILGGREPRRFSLARLAQQYRTAKRKTDVVSRLLFVPKDSRGPRTICCEPVDLMYIQKGVAGHLQDFLENRSPLRGHINFSRQDINAHKALVNSRTRNCATIDLSDASDRVSLCLVNWVLPESCDRLLPLRSTHVLLPQGETLKLKKFAPMGSALCFPVESLIFFCISVAAIRSATGSCIVDAAASVFVYGDDIVVADEHAEVVMEWLERFDLRVNRSKSFWGDSPFRESCGIDGLLGHVVTPHRIKLLPPLRPTDGSSLHAYCRNATDCVSWCAGRSDAIRRVVEKAVKRRIPYVPYETNFLSVVSEDRAYEELLRFEKAVVGKDGYYQSRELVVKNKRTVAEFATDWRLQLDLVQGSISDPTVVVERSSTQISLEATNLYFL